MEALNMKKFLFITVLMVIFITGAISEQTDGGRSMAAHYHQDIVDIDATIICERDSHKGIIIGKGGQMLKKIGSTARTDIEKLVEMRANLQLWVKVKKDWRDSDFLMKNFGYNPKDSE